MSLPAAFPCAPAAPLRALRAPAILLGPLVASALAACTPGRSVPPIPASSTSAVVAAPSASAAAAEASPSHGTVLATLDEWRRMFEREGVSVEDVTTRVGSLGRKAGGPWVFELNTRAAWLERAQLSRYAESDAGWSNALYLLELHFRPEARPTLDALGGVFGAYHVVPAGLHGERSATFYPPSSDPAWSVAVIAAGSRCYDPHSHDPPPPGPCLPLDGRTPIETITFRRDPKAATSARP